MNETPPTADIGTRDVALMTLTVASGAIDAMSYLRLGKIFTAFMTGNIVFLGLRTAHAAEFDVVRILISLLSFSVGVLLFRLIAKSTPDDDEQTAAVWPREVTTALVIVTIAEFALLAIWAWLGPSGHEGLLVGVGALAMGVQSGAIVSLGLPGVVTTAATGTVVALVAGISTWPHPATDWRRLAGVLTSLFVGAGAEGVLLTQASSYAPVVPLAATVVALVICAFDLMKHVGVPHSARRPR